MGEHRAAPLCDTCGLHEAYTKKVNFMWAAGWAILIVGMPIFGTVVGWAGNDVYRRIALNEVSISAERKMSVDRDQELAIKFLGLNTEIANDNNDIIRVLNVISINQKIVMDNAGLGYMEPEWVRRPRERQ